MKELCNFPSQEESERIIARLKWIGIFTPDKAEIRYGNLLDTLCARMEPLMAFQKGERDLVILQHKFVVEWADGKTVRLMCLSPESS